MQNNFYIVAKKGRIKAGLSKVVAARLLNVSERSLSAYENGSTAVDDDMAVKMAEIYNCPAIVYCWTRDNACGRLFLPDIDERSLSENILDSLVNIESMKNELPSLIMIGRDNQIDHAEVGIFDKIKNNGLIPLIKSSLAIIFSSKKKKLTSTKPIS